MPVPGPSDLLGRLAAIGYAPDDDADTRLRKATLTLTSATIALLASAWTLTYVALDRPAAAAIPFIYQVVGDRQPRRAGAHQARRRGPASSTSSSCSLLPVLLQWTLGGFVNAERRHRLVLRWRRWARSSS